MKSTTFALAASLIPFALASPYHMLQHAERDADTDVKVDWITDVDVVTAFTEVTVYWTGQPDVQTTFVTQTAAASSETSAVEASSEAYRKEHTGGRGGRYSIQKTTTTEAAPTTSSTYVAPAPETTSTSTYEAPETTSSTSTSSTSSSWVAPFVIPTSTYVAPIVTTPATTAAPTTTSLGSATGMPASVATLPTMTPSSNYVQTGAASYDLDNMKPAILDSTNAWRAKWFADPVVWDDGQASQAQAQAESCDWGHPRVGQNIAAGYDGPIAANNAWGGEYVHYINNDGGDDGHFTQLIWKNTKKIGCGAFDCTGNTTASGWYFVCNYDPIGNFQNDNDPPPGSYALNLSKYPAY